MMRLILNPLSKKGKQLINQFGQRWIVLWESDHVPALDGPGLFIQPFENDKEKRWICLDGSPHFTIEKRFGVKDE